MLGSVLGGKVVEGISAFVKIPIQGVSFKGYF